MINPGTFYWVPRYRYEYIEWLRRRFPETSWQGKPTPQLKAIYHSIRRKEISPEACLVK